MNTQARKPEKAILVGLITSKQSKAQTEEYLDELAFLATTAGAETLLTIVQKLDHPDPRTYVGSGKLAEIVTAAQELDADLVILDDDITASQQRNLEEALKIKVLDRSTLILDIFAARAQTAQAKTQVELAQMQYLLPRLTRMWTHLQKQKGGIGMKGPGEKEIETDRRIIRTRIALLKEKLKEIDRQNYTQRKNRGKIIRVALVGYTNVGKSTLMNLLAKAEVFAENKLFATLDATVRKVTYNRMAYLLSDTVGFIRKLPHHLVESFKSTLDELREADFILHVVDIAHPNFQEHIQVVNETLRTINAADKPTLMVYNKIDLLPTHLQNELALTQTFSQDQLEHSWLAKEGEAVFISAEKKIDTEHLRMLLAEKVAQIWEQRYPYEPHFF